MWAKVKTRFISAVFLIAALLLVTFVAPKWLFTIAVAMLTFAVMRELTVVLRQGTKPSIAITNYIFAALYMIVGFLKADTANRAIFLITILYIMTLLVFSVIDNEHIKFSDVCSSLFLVFYSVVFLMHLSFIRNLDNGIALLFMAFIGAYITDTGAYFTGMLIGKRKLIPSVSPNKTVEGAIGGIVFTVIGFIIYGIIMGNLGHTVNYFYLFILAVICGVVSQFGDLSASVIKRSFNVKDFGDLIPGHGGIVDRVDSLIFVAPVVYYFITFLPVIR